MVVFRILLRCQNAVKILKAPFLFKSKIDRDFRNLDRNEVESGGFKIESKTFAQKVPVKRLRIRFTCEGKLTDQNQILPTKPMGASSSIISLQDTKSLLFGALRDGKNVHRNEQLTLSQSQNEVKRYRQALRRWVVDANIFQFPASPTPHNNTASNPSSPLPTQVLTELELLDQNLLSSSGRLPAAWRQNQHSSMIVVVAI